MKPLIDCLRERGLLEEVTPDLIDHLHTSRGVYVGMDPTADSLHLGNLLPIMVLSWFQRYGHQAYVVMGGATGRIGDPSGRNSERPVLSEEVLEANVLSIGHFFQSLTSQFKPIVLNNNDWLGSWTLIDFLRDVGKQFRLGPMLAKEMVRTRLQSEEGISFTEFSYQVLQGYDFYYLHKTHQVTIQIGGSDQWGNITAGIELNRKLGQPPIHGLTLPLLTRSDGKKFGKSAEGAVWLSSHRFSPYQLYQYLMGIPDADVIRLLKAFTFLALSAIDIVETQLSTHPNQAQRMLAEEVVRFVHGDEGLRGALEALSGLSPGKEATLTKEALQKLAEGLRQQEGGLLVFLSLEEVVGQKYVDLLHRIALVPSRSEALRLVQNGGGYLNNERIDSIERRLVPEDLLAGEYLLMGAGKKRKKLIQIAAN